MPGSGAMRTGTSNCSLSIGSFPVGRPNNATSHERLRDAFLPRECVVSAMTRGHRVKRPRRRLPPGMSRVLTRRDAILGYWFAGSVSAS